VTVKSAAHRAAEVACELAVARTAKLEAEIEDVRGQLSEARARVTRLERQLADANGNTAAAQRMAERFEAQAKAAVAAAERALGPREPAPSTSTVGELGPCPQCGAAGYWCRCRSEVLDAFKAGLARVRR
jgi:chromosome segregation ATPase